MSRFSREIEALKHQMVAHLTSEVMRRPVGEPLEPGVIQPSVTLDAVEGCVGRHNAVMERVDHDGRSVKVWFTPVYQGRDGEVEGDTFWVPANNLTALPLEQLEAIVDSVAP